MLLLNIESSLRLSKQVMSDMSVAQCRSSGEGKYDGDVSSRERNDCHPELVQLFLINSSAALVMAGDGGVSGGV